jgi:CDP-diacylglycerol--glycerol-3-phosphate 3-phosphatidyltransferase
MAEMAGVLGCATGAGRRQDGPMGKKPRGLVFGAAFVALASGAAPGFWLEAALAATVALLVATIANRIAGAVAEARPC